jgi:tyrosyl-tRNA synthetase
LVWWARSCVSSIVTEHDAKKAGAEVVKQVEHPLLSGMLYPLLQALDEQYLSVDAQFGGVDQRKIFMFAEKVLPSLGYEKRIHLMNPMVPGLIGAKMSSSDADSKIDLLDEPEAVTRKVKKAFCEEGNVENNPLLSFCKMVLFPILDGKPFEINRPEKFGGILSYISYESMEKDFAAKQLYPGDLKIGVTAQINAVVAAIRTKFDTPEMVELIKKAYPDMPLPKFSCVKPEDNHRDRGQQQQQKKQKKQKKAAPPPKPVVEDVSRVEMKVGLIKTIEKHPDADSLFVETVDFGDHTRTIVSGLCNYYKAEELLGKQAVFLTNLKKGKLRGIVSEGMIMAASDAEHKTVEVIFCPGATPGEQVVVEGFLGEADKQVDAKKTGGVWEKAIQPFYSTNDKLEATWKGIAMKAEKSNAVCSVVSLVGAAVH